MTYNLLQILALPERQQQQKASKNSLYNYDFNPHDVALNDDAAPETPISPNASVASIQSFCQMTSSSSNLLLDSINFINMDGIYSPESYTNDQSTLRTQSSVASSIEESASRRLQYPAPAPEPTPPESSYDLGLTGTADANWNQPLHIAVQKGHDKIVRTLLQHKADCNVKDSDGVTPLIQATICGHKDIVCMLLSCGAQLDNVDHQLRSALHWAVIHRREALLRVLLDHCAGERSLIDGYDEGGKTPLHLAVDGNFEAGVQLFLQFGANVHSRARKDSLEP